MREVQNSLTEVQDVSESLFEELSAAAKQTSPEPKNIAHHEKRVKLALERLSNRSAIAHLSGLMVLDSLKIRLPNVQERLSNLQHLEPTRLINRNEANQLLAQQVREAQRLLEERTAIVEEAKTLRDKALDDYSKLNEKLTIQSSDPICSSEARVSAIRELEKLIRLYESDETKIRSERNNLHQLKRRTIDNSNLK